MRKLFIFAVICSGLAYGQGYSLENFSQFASGHTLAAASNYTTGDGLVLANSWYGTGRADPTNIFTVIQNSAGALTIQSASACAGGDPPGHSGKYLDYSSSLGNGVNNQLVFLGYPAGASTSSAGSFWFCSTIPVTDNFGTSFDGLQVIAGGAASRLSNYTSNGTSQGWNIEGVSHGSVPYTPNNWVKVVWQYVNGAACSDTTKFTDCVVLRLYNRSGTLIGTDYASVPAGAPSYMTFGNGNAATMPSGFHVQYSDIRMYTIGYTSAQLAQLGQDQLWDGIITPGRAVDWTQAGFNSGNIPSASWTQCGSTLAAGTYAGATITSNISGCGANTYYKLGTGTFNISGKVDYPTSGFFAIRGSGGNSTFVVGSSGVACPGQTSSVFCIASSDHNFTTGPPATIYNWTSGFTQYSNQMTLSSVAGIVANSTLLMSDQCNTARSGGTACGTGSATDNGNWYICSDTYSGAHGCSMSGPDAGGSRTERDQLEMHVATNIAGNVLTVSPPLLNPNWATGNSQQVWIIQPLVEVGLEDMSIDLSAASASVGCVDLFNVYQFWIKGVRCINNKRDAFNVFQGANGLIISNYISGSTGILPSNYGIRLSATANNVIANNIIQQIQGGAIFYDGAATGNVAFANFVIKSETGSGSLTPVTEHSGSQLNLAEQNAMPSYSCDNVHGTCDGSTRYRNFLPGWSVNPSNPVGTFTNGIADFAFSRYINNAANVLGTAGFHTGYTSSSSNLAIYNAGTGGGGPGVPVDPLTKSTSLYWASFDTATAGIRFCGNSIDTGWSATCGSASEVPSAASTFPNFVPVVGDTAIGEPALPVSFYTTTRPSWWAASIPFPAIGPDVNGGNLKQCSGLPTIAGTNGMPSDTSGKCSSGTANAAWGDHVNMIPAMQCALDTMGMAVDGTGSASIFNADACYAGVFLSSTSLDFGSITVGVPSIVQTIVLTNGSISPLNVASVVTSGTNSGDYSNTQNCVSSSPIASAGSCTIPVTFTPGALGSRTATITITDDGPGSPRTISMIGIGVLTPGRTITGLHTVKGTRIIR